MLTVCIHSPWTSQPLTLSHYVAITPLSRLLQLPHNQG